MILTVCSRCGCMVRYCSSYCTMGGAVHVQTEKHLCNPGLAYGLLRNPAVFNLPHLFAHAREVEISGR